MTSKAGEISSIIKEQIKQFETKIEMKENGTVITVGDGIATVYGLRSCMANELLRFEDGSYGVAQNLEEETVSVAILSETPREDDLPGSEVPQRYFTYLKTKQASLLEDILKHNAQDIASLCVLLNHMADLYQHPEKIRFSEDVYSMGRALERTDHPEQARRCYRLAGKGRMGDLAGTALAASYRAIDSVYNNLLFTGIGHAENRWI